jgi:hypothetical protein
MEEAVLTQVGAQSTGCEVQGLLGQIGAAVIMLCAGLLGPPKQQDIADCINQFCIQLYVCQQCSNEMCHQHHQP